MLLWIEREVALRGYTPPANIHVHSANPAAKQRMLAAIESIHYSAAKTADPKNAEHGRP